MLAWLVAALNIVHLLGPTLDLLDSVAVVVGGLRVSILTVVKGVLSLAMLLWAATVASNLFERRITRVSEITPRARVLLGKLIKAAPVRWVPLPGGASVAGAARIEPACQYGVSSAHTRCYPQFDAGDIAGPRP